MSQIESIKKSDLKKQLDDRLQSIGFDGEEEKAKKLAQELGLPYLDLKAFPLMKEALYLVDEETSKESGLAVIYRKGLALKIAVSDPKDLKTKKTLEGLARNGNSYQLVIVSRKSLESAWSNFSQKTKIEHTDLEAGIIDIKEDDLSRLKNEINNIGDLKNQLSSMATSQILNVLIAGALKTQASDIHLEPEEKNIRLRYRIDNVLNDIAIFDGSDYPALLSRIKLLSGLKINIHETAQDGRFTIRESDKDIEIRVSILPGTFGEDVVMRVLDPRALSLGFSDLGLNAKASAIIKNLLTKTTGAIMTTGPTGSGKTTTLYTFLKEINSPDIKIITIEDPIEYRLEGISQTQVNKDKDYTFANGLRSIVRQDPDVILVGEIRDKETADISMQAALTGHLVLTTLHTNDAAGAIPRLIDFGIKPVTIAPALRAVIAQRLVRRVCKKCGRKRKIKLEEYRLMETTLDKSEVALSQDSEIYEITKCPECNFTGYSGLIGVFEVFEVNGDIEKLILKNPTVTDIRELAENGGMMTMLQDGLTKVLEGLTTFDEIMRVIGT